MPAMQPVGGEERDIFEGTPAGNKTAGTDGALQLANMPAASVGNVFSFDGIGLNDFQFTPQADPPDTNGAVGLTQYVQYVNLSFAVFSKSGALLYGPTA